MLGVTALYHFPADAVQSSFFCRSPNIFVAAEGLRFDCGQYGSFAYVFVVYSCFPTVLCSCRTAENHVSGARRKRVAGCTVRKSNPLPTQKIPPTCMLQKMTIRQNVATCLSTSLSLLVASTLLARASTAAIFSRSSTLR